MAVQITPVEEGFRKLCAADIDAHRGYDTSSHGVAGIISVSHASRRTGRGRYPLHSISIALDDSNISMKSVRWLPDSDFGASTKIEDSQQTTNLNDIPAFVEHWVNQIIDIERHDLTATRPPVQHNMHRSSTPVVDPFEHAVPLRPHITREAQVGDAVYIVHTPADHHDIPAGTQGKIVGLDTDNESHLMVNVISSLFTEETVRSLDIEDLVFVEQPEAHMSLSAM